MSFEAEITSLNLHLVAKTHLLKRESNFFFFIIFFTHFSNKDVFLYHQVPYPHVVLAVVKRPSYLLCICDIVRSPMVCFEMCKELGTPTPKI